MRETARVASSVQEARVVVGVEVWRLKNGGSRGELFRASFNARSFLGNWSG